MQRAFQSGQFTSRTNSMLLMMKPKRLGAQTFGTFLVFLWISSILFILWVIIWSLDQGAIRARKSTQTHRQVGSDRTCLNFRVNRV